MLNDCHRLSKAYAQSETKPAVSWTDLPISASEKKTQQRLGNKAVIMQPGCSFYS